MGTAQFIIAASERDANLYYATRFLAPDAFVFLQVNGRTHILLSDLELDRGRSQAQVDEVVSMSKLIGEAKRRGISQPGMYDAIEVLLKDHQVKQLAVPGDFPIAHAEALRKRWYGVAVTPDPYFEKRVVKSEEEIAHMTQTLRLTEEAIGGAIEVIRQAEPKNGGELWLKGKPLTAETIKKVINMRLMESDCIAQHSIVACGIQAVDPHNEGSGPLLANQPIVMDIFPRHARTRYYADITRTVVRGKPSNKTKRMFDAVKEGQEIAFRTLKAGVDGSTVHKAIMDYFDSLGFKTGEMNGRMQGFFHGTGHGLGLEVHEPPRVSPAKNTLPAGTVVTVEPGLYYTDGGGIRIEDTVVITTSGCRNLTQAPKILEV